MASRPTGSFLSTFQFLPGINFFNDSGRKSRTNVTARPQLGEDKISACIARCAIEPGLLALKGVGSRRLPLGVCLEGLYPSS